MHPEALRGVQWAVRDSGAWPGGPSPAAFRLDGAGHVAPFDGLDVGGADVNGSARRTVQALTRWVINWTGLDVEHGPGVDVVADARKPVPDEDRGKYHLVLCTEVFEHVQDWSAIVLSIYDWLAPGGVALMTCASTGRRPHGARGALDPGPGEWYRNVPAEDLAHVIATAGFAGGYVKYNPTPGDAYAWARKET